MNTPPLNIQQKVGLTLLFLTLTSIILLFSLATCVSQPDAISQSQADDTPTVAATPSSTATPLPTHTPEPILPELIGDCAHPYFPAIEGRILRYESESLEYPKYSVEFVDVSEKAFATQIAVRLDNGRDLSVVTLWECTPEGLLSRYFVEGLTGIQGLRFDMQEASGITLLGASKLVLGTEWSTEYSIITPGSVETAAGVLSDGVHVKLDHAVVKIEPISVVAGNYPESYRVSTVGTYTLFLSLGDEIVQEETIDLSYDTWYVENIGLVRQEFIEGWSFEPSDDISVVELVSVD